MIVVIGSSRAPRISSGSSTTVLGRPDISSRPRTSARNSSSVGNAEPMAILIFSAVCSPMAMPCSLRMWVWMAASKSKLPTRTALSDTIPPRDRMADSEVPPPMSTTIEPIGSLIGSSAPMAAAIGCSMSWHSAAPARRAASVTARRSTWVMAEGTQITTRGRLNRDTPTRSSTSRIIRWVTSKSVMAPARSGRTAMMWPGVRPIICQASVPTARTSWLWLLRAMTDGSLRTMPSPRT